MSSATASPASRTEKACLVHQLKLVQKENAKLARSRGRILQKMTSQSDTSSVPLSPKVAELFAEVNRRHCDQLQQNCARHNILANVVSKSTVPESKGRYTVAVLTFAMLIASISLTGYKTMRNFLHLPSASYLYRIFKLGIRKLKGMITNFEEVELHLEYVSLEVSNLETRKKILRSMEGYWPSML